MTQSQLRLLVYSTRNNEIAGKCAAHWSDCRVVEMGSSTGGPKLDYSSAGIDSADLF